MNVVRARLDTLLERANRAGRQTDADDVTAADEARFGHRPAQLRCGRCARAVDLIAGRYVHLDDRWGR